MTTPRRSLPNYRLTTSSRSAHGMVDVMWQQLDLHPPYQRGAVWTLSQRRALIKSWCMGVPVPAVILNDRSHPNWTGEAITTNDPWWAVVDGKQRLETAHRWFTGALSVPAWWFPADRVATAFFDPESREELVTYEGLTLPGKRFTHNDFQLPIVESNLPSVRAEAELYLLLNSAGTAHTRADIERATRTARAY